MSIQEGVKWGMGWVAVGKAVLDVPRFVAKTLENTAFSIERCKSGHPLNSHSCHHPSHPHFTPSELCSDKLMLGNFLCLKV